VGNDKGVFVVKFDGIHALHSILLNCFLYDQ
jgi:hypothetical protein